MSRLLPVRTALVVRGASIAIGDLATGTEVPHAAGTGILAAVEGEGSLDKLFQSCLNLPFDLCDRS